MVTFVSESTDGPELHKILSAADSLLDRSSVKLEYHVDHFIVPLASRPEVIVDLARYWNGLFSHRRDGLWKGMLRTQMFDDTEDDAAERALRARS